MVKEPLKNHIFKDHLMTWENVSEKSSLKTIRELF